MSLLGNARPPDDDARVGTPTLHGAVGGVGERKDVRVTLIHLSATVLPHLPLASESSLCQCAILVTDFL